MENNTLKEIYEQHQALLKTIDKAEFMLLDGTKVKVPARIVKDGILTEKFIYPSKTQFTKSVEYSAQGKVVFSIPVKTMIGNQTYFEPLSNLNFEMLNE